MRPAALQMNPFSALLEAELRARFEVFRWYEMADQSEFLSSHSAQIRAVVAGGHVGLPTPVMRQLPALGIIAINGVGYDKVDLAEARRRGVRVTRTPGVLTEDVADLAVGLIISQLRRIPQADRHVRQERWPQGDAPLGRKVTGSRFGIVGMGEIGTAIAQRLRTFGPVTYTDPAPKSVPYRYVEKLTTLAGESDVLIVAAALTEATRGLIGREVLDCLGPTGIVVNVARGGIVNEVELVAAVENGRIAGVALDVFADEPNVPVELRKADNVVLTPHIASATKETREAMARAVLSNLDAFLSGRPLPGEITANADQPRPT